MPAAFLAKFGSEGEHLLAEARAQITRLEEKIQNSVREKQLFWAVLREVEKTISFAARDESQRAEAPQHLPAPSLQGGQSKSP